MYEKIEIIILQKRLSKKDIAAALDIGYNTLMAKLRGESKFTLDEAIALKEFLNTDVTVEELFVFAAA